MKEEIHICRASDMHPYNCDGMFGGRCEHCERLKNEWHDPATCALCDPEYDYQPNEHWNKELAKNDPTTTSIHQKQMHCSE